LSRDVSTGGVYVTTGGGDRVVPGEICTVSITIPWESRKAFPFSRIAGRCRVVRVDEVHPADEHPQQGVALAFCGDTTLLATTVRP
jgi:hypothetical protein